MTNEIIVELTKKVTMTVPHGKLKLIYDGDTVYVEYINPLYKGGTFKMPTSFSPSFTPSEIAKSSAVLKFLSRFD